MTKRMKQKMHLRSESSDSEGHFNLHFFLGICSTDRKKDFGISMVLCNLLPPHGLCSWSPALVVANLAHKLL